MKKSKMHLTKKKLPFYRQGKSKSQKRKITITYINTYLNADVCIKKIGIDRIIKGY